MTKYLFTSLGHPGSGKTYFTQRLAKKIGAMRINADALRMHMFGSHSKAREFDEQTGLLGRVIFQALDYATVQALQSGTSVIYDVQQNEKVIRDKTSKLGADNGAVSVVIWVKTPVDIAFQRGQDRDLTPDQQKHDYAAMKETIEKHLKLIEHPTEEEKVIVIDGTVPFEEQYASFKQQLSQL